MDGMISGPGFKPAPASWSLSVSSSLVLLFVFTLPPTGTLEKVRKVLPRLSASGWTYSVRFLDRLLLFNSISYCTGQSIAIGS